MKFSDNIERASLEEVFVIRTTEDMNSREEVNSNLWDLKRSLGNKNFIFSIPARDLRIGETIVNWKGNFIAYRTE